MHATVRGCQLPRGANDKSIDTLATTIVFESDYDAAKDAETSEHAVRGDARPQVAANRKAVNAWHLGRISGYIAQQCVSKYW
uniref:Integrase n=1 Tax=Panagrellus redivivus TaxID=6233 RepID=A0A7E4VST2_PANRE